MAPTTIDIPDGWYRFQIGESPLFNKKFDVVAQGGPQTWKLNAGNPWGFWGGWLIATVGFTAAVMGGLYWAGTPGLGNLPGADIAILMIGGVSVGSGGIVLMIPNYPSATRTQ